MLQVISSIFGSAYLFKDGNLDLLFEITNAAGPVLYAQALKVANESGRKNQRPQELVKCRGNVVGMVIFGSVRLRELGWTREVDHGA